MIIITKNNIVKGTTNIVGSLTKKKVNKDCQSLIFFSFKLVKQDLLGKV